MKKLILFVVIIFLNCGKNPIQFSDEALQETFTSLHQENVTFKSILEKNKGKKIVIDVWASWCSDCIAGLPDIRVFQKENPEVVFLFLSLDRSVPSWKNGIKKYQIRGEHYFLQDGKKGAFANFLNLSWIPRYLVIDEIGNIALFKAIKITDEKILQALKK